MSKFLHGLVFLNLFILEDFLLDNVQEYLLNGSTIAKPIVLVGKIVHTLGMKK